MFIYIHVCMHPVRMCVYRRIAVTQRQAEHAQSVYVWVGKRMNR